MTAQHKLNLTAVLWARDQHVAHGPAKHVLLEMACYSSAHPTLDPDGNAWPANHCWASVAELSKATYRDRSSVITALDQLQEAGLIEPMGTRRGIRKPVTVYRLQVDGSISEPSTSSPPVIAAEVCP